VNHRIAVTRLVYTKGKKQQQPNLQANLTLVNTQNLLFFSSSVAEVISKDTALLEPLAAKFNLSFTAFGTRITDPALPSYGSLVAYDAWGTHLEPAPVSPYTGAESAAYQLLSGTIKSVYNTHRGLEGNDNVKVQPGYMTGNTGEEPFYQLELVKFPPFLLSLRSSRHEILLETFY
jgi:hypothetical protein